jgi:hypothetical protein
MFETHSLEGPSLKYRMALFMLSFETIFSASSITSSPNLTNPNPSVPNCKPNDVHVFGLISSLLNTVCTSALKRASVGILCSENSSHGTKCMSSAYLYCFYKYL